MTEIPPPFDPAEGPPAYVYVKVADHLQARIRAGEWAVMLPGEQAMAEDYGVAIGTIRKALRVLRERGAVTTLPGRGTFVNRE